MATMVGQELIWHVTISTVGHCDIFSSCQINSQIHARRASDIPPCDWYIKVFAPHVRNIAVLTLESLKQS